MISLIVAMDRNRLIGNNNRMPWRLPKDLAYFRQLTLGHTVVMGRKTFESIGKPLDGRKNIILTRNKEYFKEGCIIAHSIDEVFRDIRNESECFIIGGAEIYSAFLPYAEKLYITYIDHEFEGDTYFPQINNKEWEMVSRISGKRDYKNPYDYYFKVYKRKKGSNS
ncbi:MAG: dihydrofolate reductase [Caldicoprobacterales bacterium]|jgi:dihydrofolate reductase|nr:dihydrofolate reductase [Clostridiales bacterium]